MVKGLLKRSVPVLPCKDLQKASKALEIQHEVPFLYRVLMSIQAVVMIKGLEHPCKYIEPSKSACFGGVRVASIARAPS